jgi:hypothetical protein
MVEFVGHVVKQGMTRDDARRARKNKQARPQPFVYHYASPNRDYTLEIKFRKSSVTQEELIEVIQTLLDELKQPTG